MHSKPHGTQRDGPEGSQEVVMKRKILSVLLAVALTVIVFTGCGAPPSDSGSAEYGTETEEIVSSVSEEPQAPDPEGSYTTKEDVALYLEIYDTLPDNFITKKEAREMGWNGGSLEPYAPGFCIGGDHYGNYEGNLPDGEEYHECDINTLGADSRGTERLVYAGGKGDVTAIYYTSDHYNTFEKLYEE